MTQFAAVLKAAIGEVGWSQSELARKAKGLDQSSLSNYLSGGSLPRRNTLEQICLLFPEHIRRSLTAAYLTDQIPPSASQLVSVSTVQEGQETAHHYRVGRAPAGSLLRRNLDTLERHAINDVNLANILDHLAAMAESRAPTAELTQEGKPYSLREDPDFIAAKEELSGKKGKRPKKG